VQDKSKDVANLNEQLTLLGLKVVPVTADGNCFFRFISKLLMCQKKKRLWFCLDAFCES
jgi:hypothetical protein